MRLFLACVVFVSLALPASAHADHPPVRAADQAPVVTPSQRFRGGGRVVLGEVLTVSSGGALGPGLGAGWFSYSASDLGGGARAESWSFSPNADVFLVDGLSLGGRASFWRSTVENGGAGLPSDALWTTTLAPRLGWAFAVSEDLLLWPRLHVGVLRGGSTTTARGVGALGGGGLGGLAGPPVTARSELDGWLVGFDLPLTVVLGRHAALGVGPEVTYVRARSEPLRSRSLQAAVRGSLSLTF